MKTKQQLIGDVKKLAMEKVSSPKFLEFALQKGKELADYYNANYDIVCIGLCLMDIKLKEALALNKQPEHIKMSVEFACEFLNNYDISDKEKEDIINCIEAHHGKVPFQCIEAEICANTDCYIFIHPIGVFTYMELLIKRGKSLNEQILQLRSKMEEKHGIISLGKVRDELEVSYQMFKKLFDNVLYNK